MGEIENNSLSNTENPSMVIKNGAGLLSSSALSIKIGIILIVFLVLNVVSGCLS